MIDNRGCHGNGDFRVPISPIQTPNESPAIRARNHGEKCKGCVNHTGFSCLYDEDIIETAAEQGISVEEYFKNMGYCPFAETKEEE